MDFVRQPIAWYFWLIPIMAFSTLLFYKKSKHKKEIIYFGVISMLGVFFTKQADQPLQAAYEWLYNNFPGFNLFRDASKFYLVTGVGYLGLLTLALKHLKDRQERFFKNYLFYLFSFTILFIGFLNSWPLITNKIGTMFVPRHIPDDYLVLEGFILKQPEFFRTFWTPAYSQWGPYSNQKPEVSNVSVIQNVWGELSDFNNAGETIQDQILSVYKKDFSEFLFDSASIKYVIVPIRDYENDDDFYRHYGGKSNENIKDWYAQELDGLSWLKKIDIGTKELVVYENENYRPYIYTTAEQETIHRNVPYESVTFTQKNPTEYNVQLRNISKPVYLDFSESFHPNWELRAGDFSWLSVLLDRNYFLDDGDHFKNDAGLNSFLIDPQKVCKDFTCKRNADGTYDIGLTLYFEPQSYFYLGLIISGSTLAGCLIFLGYDFVRRKKNEIVA